MRTFHGDEAIKAKYVARLKAHHAAESVAWSAWSEAARSAWSEAAAAWSEAYQKYAKELIRLAKTAR